MVSLYDTIRERYDFTWEDGDLVKYTTRSLDSSDKGRTYEMEYDNYPSIYTGYPLAQFIIYGPAALCIRGSRHNLVSEGDVYKYKNGRVVSKTYGYTTTSYTYTDETSE